MLQQLVWYNDQYGVINNMLLGAGINSLFADLKTANPSSASEGPHKLVVTTEGPQKL